MNPILKITLIIIGSLIVALIATFCHECRTWPRAEDDPTNKIDYDDL
jgi:hypothetical protein